MATIQTTQAAGNNANQPAIIKHITDKKTIPCRTAVCMATCPLYNAYQRAGR